MLNRHKLIHRRDTPHICDRCGECYNQSSYLKRHLKRQCLIHTGEGSYNCDACGKRFSHSFHLQRNKRIHTKDKPHKCDFYEKDLLNHMSRSMGFLTMWHVQPAQGQPACAYDQSLCWLLDYSLNIKLPAEHHLEFLSLKGGCTGSSESTLVKMPHSWE